MSRTVESYLKRVRRKLCAGSKTKDELIQGLRSELVELGDEPSYDDLISTFGTPSQVAAELQSSVGETEAYSARSFSKRVSVTFGVIAAVLVVTLASYMLYVSNDTADYYAISDEIIVADDYPLIEA